MFMYKVVDRKKIQKRKKLKNKTLVIEESTKVLYVQEVTHFIK